MELHFCKGLFGFPECKELTLGDEPVFRKLARDGKLFLVVAEVAVFEPTYLADVATVLAKEAVLAGLAMRNLLVLGIINKKGSKLTMNLAGPLLIDLDTGNAVQVMLTSKRYSLYHEIFEIVEAA